MFRLNPKIGLIIVALTAGWLLTFWLQHSIALTPALQLIGVPALLILLLLLAAMAVEQSDP